jgi:hypothetical protein
MGAKPQVQYTVWQQSSRNDPPRTFVVAEHKGGKLLRTFTALVYAHSTDELRVARWCEMNHDNLPADGGTILIGLHSEL